MSRCMELGRLYAVPERQLWDDNGNTQPVRETVSYRRLFTAGWFGVREKHCSQLEIYDHDRLRASEQADKVGKRK